MRTRTSRARSSSSSIKVDPIDDYDSNSDQDQVDLKSPKEKKNEKSQLAHNRPKIPRPANAVILASLDILMTEDIDTSGFSDRDLANLKVLNALKKRVALERLQQQEKNEREKQTQFETKGLDRLEHQKFRDFLKQTLVNYVWWIPSCTGLVYWRNGDYRKAFMMSTSTPLGIPIWAADIAFIWLLRVPDTWKIKTLYTAKRSLDSLLYAHFLASFLGTYLYNNYYWVPFEHDFLTFYTWMGCLGLWIAGEMDIGWFITYNWLLLPMVQYIPQNNVYSPMYNPVTHIWAIPYIVNGIYTFINTMLRYTIGWCCPVPAFTIRYPLKNHFDLTWMLRYVLNGIVYTSNFIAQYTFGWCLHVKPFEFVHWLDEDYMGEPKLSVSVPAYSIALKTSYRRKVRFGVCSALTVGIMCLFSVYLGNLIHHDPLYENMVRHPSTIVKTMESKWKEANNRDFNDDSDSPHSASTPPPIVILPEQETLDPLTTEL